MTDVTLRVHEDGADDDRIEQLTQFLRTELQELAPVSGVSGEAAPGAKSIEVAALGTLLVTLSQSTVLAALITAVSTWLGQRRQRSVTLDADGDTLEMTGSPTPEERERAAEWLARRRARRYALIIASYEFADPGLSALRAPAHDAARLGEILSDDRIGGFDVRTLINSSAAEVNEAVEDFFADRDPDDLLVLHFSGHGVKDEAGELHFATSGTKLNRLAGTAVSADFVARRMNRSRSRRIVLLLDCCYSGAFGRGMVARAGGAVNLEEQFGGSGRAVITASSSMEYAFEGAAVADSSEGEPSVFTSALVEGLESGDADRDLDGFVGLDELYEYVYDRVRRVTPHQTPGKWMLDVRGDLRIARRARPVAVPAALPTELQEAIDHSLPGVRAGAVPELRRMLSVRHEGRVLAARLALRHLAEDDSRMVAKAAREALGEPEPAKPKVPAPTALMAAAGIPPISSLAREAAGQGAAGKSVDNSPPVDNSADVDLRRPASSAPRGTIGVGTSVSPGGGEPESIPKPWQIGSRIVAGLALVAVVLGIATTAHGMIAPITNDLIPPTAFLAFALPWVLAAALFVTTCRDHPWAPGAALGLAAGVAGLLGGTSDRYWMLLAGLALTALVLVRPHWTAITAAVVGAAAAVVMVAEAGAILGESSDPVWPAVFAVAVAALVGLAGYQLRTNWRDAIAPALLLANAAWAVLDEGSYPYSIAFLPLLLFVPLAEVLTTGTAKLAARLTIAAVLLVRSAEYAGMGNPDANAVAHILLILAAMGAAYYSRSR